MIQPFEITHGIYNTKYEAWFCGTDKKKDLPDKERYKAMVRIDPWGELVEFECECKSYKFNKGLKLCKHLSGTSEPGILQILKEWHEIDKIPKIKDLEPKNDK